ncbi:MAG: GspE/PulE family protein [bacterium]|nr:GspE/PulE family protein [bacterium]
MTASPHLTLEQVAQMLLKCGLITPDQHREILIKVPAQRAKLQKYQESAYSRRLHQAANIITPAEVISSLNIQVQGQPGRYLTEDMITLAVAQELKIPYRKIDPLKLQLDVVTSHVARPYAIRHLIVPLEEESGTVTMAVADPSNLEILESLETARNIKIKLVLSSKTDILKIVREFYGFRASVRAAEVDRISSEELNNLEQFVKLKGQEEIEANDQHVTSAVEYLLHYAFEQRASDIHIEPKRDKSYIRLRIDGVLHYIYTIPRNLHAPIISRIKIMSRMNIADKRRPQDGRIKTSYAGKDIELRVSTVPVTFGEKVVIRIFDPEILMQDLDHLGFYPREYQTYNAFIRRPNGIILVTGPTGSGKTTTLYSSLKALSSPEVNIISVEDPIEMVIEEFNQIGVQPAAGVTFSTILPSILRQDPDIIMVGEIRDRETAEHAIQAALTGHLVLTTLHTNDAPSAMVRLLDIGIPYYLISSTVIGVMAQRLVRRICPNCRRERLSSPEDFEGFPAGERPDKIYYGEGCVDCRGTGYKGRIGIFEVMEMTDNLKSVLTTNTVNLNDIYRAAAADGMVSLKQVALQKMLEGLTTYEEVISVSG